VIDHRELSRLLDDAGAEADASACHGFLCGQICAVEFPDEELWMEFLDVQRRDDASAERCYAGVRALAAGIERELQQLDFSFRILLPDDDRTLTERVDALAGWCSAFLEGFALSAEVPAGTMTQDCQELLEDLAAIGNATAGEPEEGAESDLVEVVEYVRIGVMTLFETGRHGRDASGKVH
jgi:uncharacterized protein YgfB (UPF0149 family)